MTPLPGPPGAASAGHEYLYQVIQDKVGWLCSYLMRAGGLRVPFTISLTLSITSTVYHSPESVKCTNNV
jgi:hypothetical protein